MMKRILLALLPLAALAAPPRVEVGDPVLVVEGPASEHRWGRYQFPKIWRGAGGEVIVFVHVEADAAESYGKPEATFVSTDGGVSWRLGPNAAQRAYGPVLPNGDRLQTATTAPLPVDVARLPKPVGQLRSYANDFTFYRLADLPEEMRLIFFNRFPAGGKSWQRESTELTGPGVLRIVLRGNLPRIWWGDLRVARDRSLVAVISPDSQESSGSIKGTVTCYRSTDSGHNWPFQGRIGYEFDPAADQKGAGRDGYSEPALEVLKDGSLLTVLRTTDGNGVGPMYYSRSKDLGRTWTRPKAFAPTGVMPRLLLLGNGTLVLTSGRPGVDLRFSFDGRGEHWTEPRPLVPADASKPQADSCGYTDLLALDRDTFLMVYTWFKRPGADGLPHKSVLVRRVTVTR